MKSFVYDLLYRFGAPWEGEPRDELVQLVRSGRLSPSHPGPRAVDLGCGSGANAIFLAERGFDVTGIDFSEVALRKAATSSGSIGSAPRFVKGDLTAPTIPEVTGTFDLLVDYGTLDDLKPDKRVAMAQTIRRLSKAGSMLLLWCFYGDSNALRLFSFNKPSRVAAGLRHGEEEALFAADFAIETISKPDLGQHGYACFLMIRR